MSNPLLKTRVWCGFPGVGKSTLFNNSHRVHDSCLDVEAVNTLHDVGVQFHDSDSSKFSKEPEWPQNYIQHIRQILTDKPNAVIMVSTHHAVVSALGDSGVEFGIVIPSIRIKDEYLARYLQRGNDSNFIHLVDQNWSAWLTALFGNLHAKNVVILGSGQYLSDVLGG